MRRPSQDLRSRDSVEGGAGQDSSSSGGFPRSNRSTRQQVRPGQHSSRYQPRLILQGPWHLTVDEDVRQGSLYDTEELCTHNIPNKVQLVNKSHNFRFDNEDIYRINILENYRAEAVVCNNG